MEQPSSIAVVAPEPSSEEVEEEQQQQRRFFHYGNYLVLELWSGSWFALRLVVIVLLVGVEWMSDGDAFLIKDFRYIYQQVLNSWSPNYYGLLGN